MKALGLLLEGWPDTRIADAVGVDRQTIYRWKKLPAFAAAVDAHYQRLRREAGLKLGAVACKAVSVLEGQLENTNSDVRYRAAAMILKAALGRAPKPAAGGDDVDTKSQQ